MNQSKLFHPQLTIEQYFEDMHESPGEHLEEYVVFSCAAQYLQMVVILDKEAYTGRQRS